jgi:catechol 2,3-dioxygenase-like lactoylglutathione lyase family enzyme
MEQRLSLVTLGVRDLARARRFYEALGWTTRAEPEDDVVFFRGGYSGVFVDPEGHPWEVAHNPGWTIADDGSVTLPS